MGVPQPNPPTVAEIVGRTADGAWPHDGRGAASEYVGSWQCASCGEEVPEFSEGPCSVDWRNAVPSPDDMLAWLHAYSSAVIVHAYEHHVEVNVGSVVYGSTLAEALEAAVRVVAAGGVVGETEPADPKAQS